MLTTFIAMKYYFECVRNGDFNIIHPIGWYGSDCHVHQNKKMNFLNGRYREFHSEIKISQNDRTGNKYRG